MQQQYWIIDILPKQVPANSDGQYHRVEKFFLNRKTHLRQKYVNLLLKLNCYYGLEASFDGEVWARNPAPETLEQMIMTDPPNEHTLYFSVSQCKVLMTLENDSTYMTVYNPTGEFLELISQLATAEGVFVWRPQE